MLEPSNFCCPPAKPGVYPREIIHHQCYLVGVAILIGDQFQKKSPISLGFAFADGHQAFASQRFAGKKHIADSQTAILVILLGCLPG